MNELWVTPFRFVHVRSRLASFLNKRIVLVMKLFILIPAFALFAACATTVPYGPAAKDGAKGYSELAIENNRYRVSYRDNSVESARANALRRAAEITLEQDADWFRIVNAYNDDLSESRSGGTSVSIGGSTGSRGRSSVGVGIGIGLPLGGGSSGPVTHVLEILTGTGEKPADAEVYDARSVLSNLSG